MQSDLRVLDALADEMDVHLGLPDADAARRELGALVPGITPAARETDRQPDARCVGQRQARRPAPPASSLQAGPSQAFLATWHHLLDAGRMQDGEPNLAGTARAAVAQMSAATAAEAGVGEAARSRWPPSAATITVPAEITDMPDRVVWLPTNSAGCAVRGSLGAGHGSLVTVRSAHMTGLALRAGAPGRTCPTLADFGHDPWWLIIIKVLVVFVFLLLGTRCSRSGPSAGSSAGCSPAGPNRAGPFGLLQSLVDGIKLALKEDIVPRGVDKVLFWIAPAISAIPAFISFAVIPFGPDGLDLRHAPRCSSPTCRWPCCWCSR